MKSHVNNPGTSDKMQEKHPACTLPGIAACIILFFNPSPYGATLEVGPGKGFVRMEDACAEAVSGDTVLVYPKQDNAVYKQPVMYVDKSGISFLAVNGPGRRVRLSGAGFNYTGAGSTPRAMFQFNPGADDCLVEGFEISDCHNDTYNGAAVRINQASGITVRDCEIHHHDMGLMSNGDAAAGTGADQLIENCIVHDNGNDERAGYNHNFYMGGTSVTIRGCDVYAATTGHNIKSRAHVTIVEACFVHDSPNREFDLVDDEATLLAGSHALISGCVIRKMDNCTGNRATIHFGQDGGGDHNGTLYIVNCTILSQYVSPVVDVSAQSAGAQIFNSIILDPTLSLSGGQTVISVRDGAQAGNCGGARLWMSAAFSAGSGVTFDNTATAAQGEGPAACSDDLSSGDCRPRNGYQGVVDAGVPVEQIAAIPASLAQEPLLEYVPQAGWKNRVISGLPDIGAYEATGSRIVYRQFPHAGRRSFSERAVPVFDCRGRIAGSSIVPLSLTRPVPRGGFACGSYLAAVRSAGKRSYLRMSIVR